MTSHGSQADELLDALDPEQRQVAEALRGPVRVLAGAGTGKTRAITHRIAHGVHDGRLRADRGARGDVHDPRRGRAAPAAAQARRPGRPGPHVPQRGAAAAALLLAARPRHRAADADRVEARDARRRHPAARAARRSGAAARPGLRDRVGQGEQRRARRLPADRRPARTQRLRPAARDGQQGLQRLRGGQARAGPDGHGGRAAVRRRRARVRRAGRRPGPAAVQVVRRRRVPGRLPAAVGAARPVARRPRRALRGGRPGADDLLVRRRRRDVPPRLPEALPRHHLDRAGPQLPLHAPGRRRRQHAAQGQPRAPGSSCAPSSRPDRRCGSSATPTRSPRRRTSPTRSPRSSARAPRPGRSRCCSGSTPSRSTSRTR